MALMMTLVVRNPCESGSFDEFGSQINFCKSPSSP